MGPIPIELTLYDPETHEPTARHICLAVPWRLFKAAIRLSSGGELTRQDIDSLKAILVELFGHRITTDDLDRGSTPGEMITVLNRILARLSFLFPAPPSGGEKDTAPVGAVNTDWITDLEISIIRNFTWSMHDLDETDVDSLFPIINHLPKSAAPGSMEVYCDDPAVAWL